MVWSYISIFLLMLTIKNVFTKQEYDRQLFASKEPYDCIDNLPIFDFLKLNGYHQTECKVMQVNCVFRHGTRNPSKKDVTHLQSLIHHMKNNSGFLQNDKLNVSSKLINWIPTFNLQHEKHLTISGMKELKYLGESFFTLLQKSSSLEKQRILYISSDTNRTISSCISFITGFADNISFKDASIMCSIRNDLMRFFDVCHKYLIRVEDNVNALQEAKSFREGKEMSLILSNFRKQYNIKDEFLRTYKHLKAAYNVAGTEIANLGHSTLEDLFTTEELKVLEYASDLKSYWKKSYGHKINYEQSCPLLRDMFLHIDKVVQNQSRVYRGIFRFGHAETILPVLSLLGLYKDDIPLRANNYEYHKDRRFRTGNISQFAANIAFVLHKCDSNNLNQEEYMLLLLHNERPIHFPCCPSKIMCPYSVVRQYYSKWIDNCDFKEICNIQNESVNLEPHTEF